MELDQNLLSPVALAQYSACTTRKKRLMLQKSPKNPKPDQYILKLSSSPLWPLKRAVAYIIDTKTAP